MSVVTVSQTVLGQALAPACHSDQRNLRCFVMKHGLNIFFTNLQKNTLHTAKIIWWQCAIRNIAFESNSYGVSAYELHEAS